MRGSDLCIYKQTSSLLVIIKYNIIHRQVLQCCDLRAGMEAWSSSIPLPNNSLFLGSHLSTPCWASRLCPSKPNTPTCLFPVSGFRFQMEKWGNKEPFKTSFCTIISNMQPYSLYVYCSPSPANIDLAICLVRLWTSLTLAFSPAILPQADSLCSIRDWHTRFKTIPLIWDEQCETCVAYTEKGQGWRKTKYLPKIDMRNRSEQAGKKKTRSMD